MANQKEQHTPGPWVVSEENGKLGRMVRVRAAPQPNAPAPLVCRVSRIGAHRSEVLANANLIACAPELLDVVKEALETMPLGEGDQSFAPWFRKARAVIKKAGG